mgnify:CR=1 FL=1
MGKYKFSLPRERYDQLKKAKRDLHDLLPAVDAFGECGGDCDMFRNEIDKAQQILDKIETHFFTPPPA